MEDTLKNKLEQSIKDWCEKHDLKFNEDVFNKMIEGLPVDIEELYEDVLYHECDHEDYVIEEEEDYNGRCCEYAFCPYCGKTGTVWINHTDEGPEQEIDWE